MSAPSFYSLDAATRSMVLRHVAAMIARVQSFFAQHQDDHLKRLRGHFFEQVDSRPHTSQAQNLRTAGVMLDKQAAIFNRAFQAALRESIEDEVEAVMPGALRVLRPAADGDDLSGPSSMALLDVDEIERHLLVDRVAQRFNNRYEAPLKALTVSIGALLRQDEFTLADNPFRPASLVRAFLIAWHSSAFDPMAAEDFVSALEPQCSIDWTALYTDLTAMLVRAGYSAKPVHRIKRGAAGGGADSASAPLTGDSGLPTGHGSGYASLQPQSGGTEFGETGAMQAAGGQGGQGMQAVQGMARSIAHRARQFLQKLGFGGPGGGAGGEGGDGGDGSATAAGGFGGGGGAHAPADPELMGFLGGLQAGAGASQFPAWAQGQDIAGHNVLRQMRDRDEVQRATEIDRGTVDALAEVFDYVFADKAIPLQLKFVIGRLQIPVLKAALIDRDFFLSGEHPARQLVDALAAAAVGWVPESGETDPLYQQIDGTVRRVVAEFEADLALFRSLLAELEAFLQANQQQAEVRIEPAANDEQSKEAREAALSHADSVVHQCIHALPIDEPLPPFLLPFLTLQWREVLARAWLLVDSEPARWDLAVKTMDEVIWSTRPRFRPDERGRLMALLPDLVPRLDTSLDAIGWTGPQRDEFTKRLIACHMRAIRVPKAGAAPADSGPGELEAQVGREAIQALDQRVAPAPQHAPDAFDAIAQGLERGMWFDFEHDADQTRRYRLGWISPQRSRMLFTNRDGFEAFVRSQKEVAAMLREGRLTILDQQPIVARALEQIMAQDDDEESGAGGAPTLDLQLG
ncbi:MAG: DUF1631 family protein [Rhodoferax sp.]|nr:DUF1631 family protein [Rhodoferax sp.]